VPPPARAERGSDHHADREIRGDRQGARPRARSRRLHHQAVLDERISVEGQGGSAAGRHGAPPEGDGDDEPLSVVGLDVDFAKRTVRVRDANVKTTYVEFEILSALSRAPGRVFTRDMLLERVWGDAAFRDPRTIDVHIRHLREKLERDAKEPEYIFTVRGVGYLSQ